MKTLKITLAVVLFSLTSNAVVAQDRKSISEDQKTEMKEQRKKNFEKMALTPDQVDKFKLINQKFGDKIKEIKKSELSKKEKFVQIKDLREQKNTEMKAILSESQYKTYLELQEERIEKMKENLKERRNGM